MHRCIYPGMFLANTIPCTSVCLRQLYLLEAPGCVCWALVQWGAYTQRFLICSCSVLTCQRLSSVRSSPRFQQDQCNVSPHPLGFSKSHSLPRRQNPDYVIWMYGGATGWWGHAIKIRNSLALTYCLVINLLIVMTQEMRTEWEV